MAKDEPKKTEEKKYEYEVISGSYTTRVEKEVDGKKVVERTKLAVGEKVMLTEKAAKNLTNIVRRVDAPPILPVEAPGSVLPKADAVIDAEKITPAGSKKDASVTPQENAELTGTAGTGSLDKDHNGDGAPTTDQPQTTTGKKVEDKENVGGAEGSKVKTTEPATGAKK